MRSDRVITLAGKAGGSSAGANLENNIFPQGWFFLSPRTLETDNKSCFSAASTCHHRLFSLIARLKTFETGVISTFFHFKHWAIWRRPTSVNRKSMEDHHVLVPVGLLLHDSW